MSQFQLENVVTDLNDEEWKEWINMDGLPLDPMEQLEANLYEERRARYEADKEVQAALKFYRRRWLILFNRFCLGMVVGILITAVAHANK
jgi:hypothetical protein